MTSETLAPPDEMVALRHRVAALEAESARLRAQLAMRAVDTETVEVVAIGPPPDGDALRQALDTKDALLAEKDLLLQEVHHRVKNSVQMVQNLLNLQARSCTDATAAAQLADSAARVHMIGAVHDRLYRSGGTLAIEIRPYLEELVRDLRDGLASAVAGRTVRVEADAVTWPAAQVPPLGLILTELVTNALRYGTGRIDVTFRQDGLQGWATLTVEDEGTALPSSFEPAHSRGLGMRLVLGMLRRKGAGLSIDRSCPHTRFVVRLPAA